MYECAKLLMRKVIKSVQIMTGSEKDAAPSMCETVDFHIINETVLKEINCTFKVYSIANLVTINSAKIHNNMQNKYTITCMHQSFSTLFPCSRDFEILLTTDALVWHTVECKLASWQCNL